MKGTPPFRTADAVTKGLTGCCAPVRLVLGTAEVDVVVLVTVLPVAEVAAGRGAELPVALREKTKENCEQLKKSDTGLMFAIFACVLHIQMR